MQKEDPSLCKSWRERLVFLGSIKSLIAECAVSSCEGLARGETQRPLYVLPRSLELLLRAVGDLEEFRVGNNMVLFVGFESRSGRHLRQGSSNYDPQATACVC